MFYFTDKTTNSVVSFSSAETSRIYEDSVVSGDVIVQSTFTGGVYRTTDSISAIHATSCPQDLILVTASADNRQYLFPERTIKFIRPDGAGSLLFFSEGRTSSLSIVEDPATVLQQSCNPSSLPVLSNVGIILVTADGNDASAMAAGNYDLSRPFKNPTVAMANAAVGDTVNVYGRHTIGLVANGDDIDDDGNQQMVVDSVALNMMPGSSIEYNNQTGTASLPFNDAGTAATFTIKGCGNFVFNRDISGGDSFLVTTHANTEVDWEFDEIDIRRRWGGNGHNARSWRMVGKSYLQRESMVFAFRFPFGATASRFIDIDIQSLEIRNEFATNTQWTREEIRFFNGSSVANIRYGEVTYVNGYPSGAFHQNVSVAATSTINLIIDSGFSRTGDDAINDYAIVNITNNGKELIDITGINTSTALVRALFSTVTGGKKTYNLNGVVRTGSTTTSTLNFVGLFGVSGDCKVNLDIVMQSITASLTGITALNSPETTISGRVKWLHTANPSVVLNAAASTLGHGRISDLRITDMETGVACIENNSAGAGNIRIINCYATNDVSIANGGVNQQIETINVEQNV